VSIWTMRSRTSLREVAGLKALPCLRGRPVAGLRASEPMDPIRSRWLIPRCPVALSQWTPSGRRPWAWMPGGQGMPQANGFSKKVENHAAAISLHFFYMNWGRPHKSLANPYPRTPAMAAGLSDHLWTCEEIAEFLD